MTQPANGTVVVAADGAGLTYQPDPNYCNTQAGGTADTFTYTLAPGGSTATVEVTVTCVADDPTAVDDTDDVTEDDVDPAAGNVLDNDVEVDPGDVLEVATVNGDAANVGVAVTGDFGTLVVADDGSYSYTLDNTDPDVQALAAGELVTDIFTYEANDGDATDGAALTVTVTGVNDAPVAVDDDDDAVTEDATAPAVGNVLTNDSDVDTGDVLTVATVNGVAGNVGVPVAGSFGTLVVAANGSFSYTLDNTNPDVQALAAGEQVTDIFSYEATDGTASDAATLTVTVTGVNDPPVAVDDTADITEDATDPAVGNVLGNDSDVDGPDPLTVATVNGAAGNVGVAVTGTYGTLVINADGTFSYTLDNTLLVVQALAAGQLVTDTFTYESTDGTANAAATLTVTVTGANDGLIAIDDIAAVTEDDVAPVVGNVLDNDNDVDLTDELTVATVDGISGNVGAAVTGDFGTVEIADDGAFTYTLDNTLLAVQALAAGQEVTDTFAYEATDGTVTAAASLTVTITGVDDPPVAVDDVDTVTEDDAATPIDVLANDTDVDAGPISIASATDPANGTVVVAVDGSSLTYEPDPDYCNDPPGDTPDTFTYTLTPGTSTASVEITVTCVADPPTIDNSAGPLDYTENDPATAIDPAVTIDNPDATTITDATVSITTNFQTGQDVLDWIDNDPTDGITEGTSTADTIELTGDGTAAEYTAALAAVTYLNSSDNPSTLTRTVTFTITAGTAATDTIDITVTAVDDPPVAVDDTATVTEDSTGTVIDVLDNDTDIDGGPIDIDTISNPDNGTVMFDGTDLTYIPDPNYCNNPPGTSPDTFTYTLAPGGSTATVSVTVTCVNDAPTAQPQNYMAHANMRISIPEPGLLAGATDVDVGATLTVGTINATTPAGGTITGLNPATGAFEFDPPAGFTGGNVTFTYTVCDNGIPLPSACSAPATVTVAVSGPVIWFVDDSAAAGGTGRLSAPFNTLAAAVTAIGSDTAERVFLYDGTYPTGITLNQGGWLVGQGVTGASFDAVMGITPPTGTLARPPIATGTATVQNTVGLATSAQVSGVAISSTTNTALTGSGGLTGVNVTQTTLATTAGTALLLNNVAGTITITNLTKNGAGSGIDLTNTNAAVTVAAGAISNTTGAAVSLDGGTGTFSYAGTVTNSAGRSVQVQNKTAGTATFSGTITATGGTGIALITNTGATIAFTGAINLANIGATDAAFSATGGGTITATNTTNQITAFTGTGINLNAVTIGAASITFNTITSGGTTAVNGIQLANVAGPGSVHRQRRRDHRHHPRPRRRRQHRQHHYRRHTHHLRRRGPLRRGHQSRRRHRRPQRPRHRHLARHQPDHKQHRASSASTAASSPRPAPTPPSTPPAAAPSPSPTPTAPPPPTTR